MILDEATASVDADNESYIQEAISELCRGKTLLVIAHRLNTIRGADQILVVSDGTIIQRGNHETLIINGRGRRIPEFCGRSSAEPGMDEAQGRLVPNSPSRQRFYF